MGCLVFSERCSVVPFLSGCAVGIGSKLTGVCRVKFKNEPRYISTARSIYMACTETNFVPGNRLFTTVSIYIQQHPLVHAKRDMNLLLLTALCSYRRCLTLSSKTAIVYPVCCMTPQLNKGLNRIKLKHMQSKKNCQNWTQSEIKTTYFVI